MTRKIKKIIGVVFGSCMLFLVGCSNVPGEVKVSKIEEDIPEEIMEVWVNSNQESMEMDSLEVTERFTEDSYEKVYCDFEMSNDEYHFSGVYVCEYIYSKQSGWCLDDYWLENVALRCEKEIPEILEFCMEKAPIYYNGTSCEVQSVKYKSAGDSSFEFSYDIKSAGTYRYIDGVYKITYSLVPSSSTSYYWEKTEDASGVTTTWDIVGKYTGESSHVKCEIVIDSFDQKTKEAHIKSYYYEEDYPWLGGDEVFELSDIKVDVNLSESDYGSVLSFNFKVKSGEYHAVSFRKDEAFSSSMKLERDN